MKFLSPSLPLSAGVFKALLENAFAMYYSPCSRNSLRTVGIPALSHTQLAKHSAFLPGSSHLQSEGEMELAGGREREREREDEAKDSKGGGETLFR